MAEILLSKKEVMCKLDDAGDISLRDVELGLLKSIFTAVFRAEKDLKKSILARDLFEQVENLTDAEEKITLTKDDMVMFSQGWEYLSGVRPPIWLRCTNLIKQLV